MKYLRALLFAFAFLSVAASAQGIEEVVVTGMRASSEEAMPGTLLRKTGDYLLLQVEVVPSTVSTFINTPPIE